MDIVVKNNWAIIHRESKTFRNKDELIFPYNSRSVSAGFQRVRNELGIEDLRYHDLRREGASRLFEKGDSIEEVAQVTGHRNLNILWQLFPHKLHNKQP
ncbi:tyrosine-type recombinase/integrase [Vibrio splendidus]|uniref:tyrosine-type recombinase/integrase n=1 Tax=Vibrio splendidus TaxID=29497 RepID=UPI000D36EC2E|nr:tyrosine-type recombinase/integrase [Vibrio splendidus]PTO71493.1 integrase [Vibrio splendidus]